VWLVTCDLLLFTMAPQPHLQNQRPMVDGENVTGQLVRTSRGSPSVCSETELLHCECDGMKKTTPSVKANIANIYEQPLKSHPTLRHKWSQ
jgi:hypothetical protein